jgi:hypothetical protein
MKYRFLIVFFVLAFWQSGLYAQNLLGNYSKSISIGLGSAHNIGIEFRPDSDWGSPLYNDNAPSISANLYLGKTTRSNFVFQMRYSRFQSEKNTIYTGTFSPDPNSYNAFFDLNGHYSLFALGSFWERYLGLNLKCQPYVQVGGEIKWSSYSGLVGSYFSSEFEGVKMLEHEPKRSYTINFKLGIGLRHELNERFTLFEQVDMSYRIWGSSEDLHLYFLPQDSYQEVVLNLSVGLSIRLGKLSE